jgi:multiple sugar transport system permease protein
MGIGPDKRPPWYQRLLIHAILLGGGVFFILPLVWMIATSLKPLEQTMQNPENLVKALMPMGASATIDGQKYEVVLERPIPQGTTFWIVKPTREFAAGELALPFGPDAWKTNPAFSKQELERMNAPVKPGMRVLADEKSKFDPATGKLTLCSGNVVPAELVRRVDVTEDKTWLVREWRSADTDTKEMSSNVVDVARAWDILPEAAITQAVRPILENYPTALRRVNFWPSLLNTLFLCAMAVSGAVVSSVIVAYGFAFLEFRGRNVIFALTLATIMIPFVVTMVPVYLMYRELGWVGTFKPLWVSAWFGSAFFVFLLRQFFLGLPKDLLDAARIDGCGELEILWHVVVPLSRPAIAMVALFTFLGTWKDFFGPMIYLNHPSQMTLSLSLQSFASEHGGTPWHLLMAAATVFSLPLIILFFFTVKTFIKGVAMTGLKG